MNSITYSIRHSKFDKDTTNEIVYFFANINFKSGM